ncbi:MAG: patatin-like phospholipase family protein [Coxiellaceae bacterium]|nr:patatin-like phospholipase family protein [Coxiellaceae bacterium]
MRKFFTLFILLIGFGLLSACAGAPPNIRIPKTPPPAPILKHPARVALVLGSGGARGYAHLGVLQVLQWAGVPIDLVVGASAGSYVGAVFADSGNATKAYHIMMHAGFWNMADVGNFPSLKGIMTGWNLEKYLLSNMHARDFRQLKIKYVAATTDLLTGKSYMIQSGPIPPAVVASAAVPGVVRPVHLYGHTLVDGGVADPVPVKLARRFHPRVIIAVNIAEQLYPVIPSTGIGIFERANNIIWTRLTGYSLMGANVVIRPKVGDVGTFDMDARYQMYLAGYYAALKALPRIKRLLRQHHIALIPKSKRVVK